MSSNGWLDPRGKFYKCNFRDHANYAEDKLGFREDVLEKWGWIKLSNNSWITPKPHLTQAQINFVFEWFQGHKKPISNLIKYILNYCEK